MNDVGTSVNILVKGLNNVSANQLSSFKKTKHIHGKKTDLICQSLLFQACRCMVHATPVYRNVQINAAYSV